MDAQMQTETPTLADGNVAGHGAARRNGSTWTRVAALTGVVFAAALALNVFSASNEPSSTASAAKVAHYYLTHRNQINTKGLLGAVAVLFGLGFFSYLQTQFRRVSTDALAGLYFTGVLVFAVGGAIGTGLQLTLGDSPKSLSASSLQTLNMLNLDLNWPMMSIGLALMYLAIGIIVVRSHVLPAWVGWLAIAVAVTAGSLFFSFISFILVPVWVLVASIVLAVRNPQPAPDGGTTR